MNCDQFGVVCCMISNILMTTIVALSFKSIVSMFHDINRKLK